ncbi:hypothetical protein PAXRUDRAFT_20145 [Paxillus rubicundulus Ve08.2h10]|uniref:Unplaced genomic scaffold scaffold_4282, whole genome shotgun sequence n=1 Tax=Paxillus rubicundulus Ve08.2h10 TaxID=930991 RepID=A0A0D0CT34_9AGAM|nr:hypothetical protein PAXRUDRAFT_20145 [Paxillus rubicundulus Ve08.2h10]
MSCLSPPLPAWAPHEHVQSLALDPEEKSRLLTKATPASFLKLHQHNYLRVQRSNGNFWKARQYMVGAFDNI